MLEINKIYNIDCFIGLNLLETNSVDLILCDLPYGITVCNWDKQVSLSTLWSEYKRVIKDNGAIILTASQPFTSELVVSNKEWFKCEWIWAKNRGSNFGSTRYQPMKEHESVLVFGKGRTKYNPIKEERKGSGLERVKYDVNLNTTTECYKTSLHNELTIRPEELRVPSSIQAFNIEVGIHPTQKPVALFEYFIETYSDKGDLVLDNCIGSGTTAIACINLGRNYIGFDNGKCQKSGSSNYGRFWADIAQERVEDHVKSKIK